MTKGFVKFAFMKHLAKLFSSIAFIFALSLVACSRTEDGKIDSIPSVAQESVKPDQPQPTTDSLPPLYTVRRIKVRNLGPLSKLFNDSNYQQLVEAKNLGIEPFGDLSSYYFTKRPLVKVASGRNYQIDSLRHSVPYLVPEAASLLNDIGANFIDSLSKRGGDSYKIKVTSLLRTPESVGRLRRVNINATDSSTHQYATTFDISYTNFCCLDTFRQIHQGDLKNLLGEVLNDLRLQGRCMVKYEVKTGCFHVTAIR